MSICYYKNKNLKRKTNSNSGVVGVLHVLALIELIRAGKVDLFIKRSAGTEMLRPNSDEDGGFKRNLRCLLLTMKLKKIYIKYKIYKNKKLNTMQLNTLALIKHCNILIQKGIIQ